MTDDLSKNNSSELALPMGKIRVPKFLYIILIVLGVLVLIVSGFNFYLKNLKEISTNKTSKISQNSIELNKSEVAKSVINWLNIERDDRGLYWFGQECSRENITDCSEKERSNYVGILVMWGMNKYYLSTKDQNILKIIKNDIYNYVDENKVPDIGSNQPVCEFIDDIKNNNDLSQIDKQNLDSFCIRTEYPINFNYQVFNQSEEEIKSDLNKKIKMVLNSDINGLSYTSDRYTDLIQSNVGLKNSLNYVSEFFYRDKFIPEKGILRRAFLFFDINLDLYLTNSVKKDINEFACKIGRSALVLNQNENNNDYIELAKRMFDLYAVGSNYLDCTRLADGLYKKTGDELFLQYKNDYFTNLEKSINQGDKISFFTEIDGNNKKINVGENGIIVGLLMD